MRIHINKTSQGIEKKWEELLKDHPHNTIFQSYDMYKFYEKVQNFEPFLFLCENEEEGLVGVLLAVIIKEGSGLKGYLSSRVVVYGGPILDDKLKNKTGVLNLLLESLVDTLKRKSMFIQFRNFFEWTDSEKQIFSNHGFVFRDRINLLVDTTDRQTTMIGISASKKRQIRRALESGACIEEPQSEDEVKIYYNLLLDLYKNKVRKPLPDWSFFREFYYNSLEGKLGIIRLVKVKDRIIGGILSPITVNKNIYEWYVVGLDEEYKKQFPSILATWAPIDYALKNQLQHFDFMGLGKPDVHYGVRDFKMKFGKEVVNYGRFGRRNNKTLYKLVEFAYNIARSLGKV